MANNRRLAKSLGGRLAVAALIALVAVAVLLRRTAPRQLRQPPRPVAAQAAVKSITDIGPRLVSNQTTTPVLVMGRGLSEGDRLVLGPPANTEVALADADGAHGWARLPAIDLPADKSEADIAVTLKGGAGQARLTVANDAHFADPVGLAVSDGWACAISSTTDELSCARGEKRQRLPLGDGPTAVSVSSGAAVQDRALLVGYEFSPELWRIGDGWSVDKLPGPAGVTGIAVEGEVAYVAEHLHNQLHALDLKNGAKELWTADLDPGPGPVAVADDLVAVGSRQTGQVQLVQRSDGKVVATLSPAPDMPIVGGHTAPYAKYIDGGLKVRDLAYSKKHKLLFVASAGPNIGPNPDRMEVAMNGGVTVIDPVKREVRYHLGFGAGVTEGLAPDDARDCLYASDLAIGVVRVLDVARLAAGPKGAEKALLQTVAIPPPEGFPRILPDDQLGVKGRAGVELHSGPSALAMWGGGDGSSRWTSVYALDRLSGTLAELKSAWVQPSRAPVPKLVNQTPLFDMLTQPERRKGEVVYYSDVGKTGMSCDACHPGGHVGGLLFSKTKPIRLYRATSIRGARETPPYFIPPSEQSLASTASFVGSRNRYQNPKMSEDEIRELALYTSEIPTPPNPFVAADGSLPPELKLPDGETGHPHAGSEVFFGKGACATCHPGPLFTTDQSPVTRGRHVAVGTPTLFPLRTEMQDPVAPKFPAQSLNGIWDLFPLGTTGFAGFAEKDGQLVVDTRFPLRAMLEHRGPAPHGEAAMLSKAEENDLLAFLMTL